MRLGIAHALRERLRRDGLFLASFHAALVIGSVAGLAFGLGVVSVAMAVVDAPGAFRRARRARKTRGWES